MVKECNRGELKKANDGRPSLTPKSAKDPVIGETPPSFLAASLCSQEMLSDKSITEWAVLFHASLAPPTWSFWKQSQPLASSLHPKLLHLEITTPLATAEPFLLLFQVTLPQGNDCEAGQIQAEKAD